MNVCDDVDNIRLFIVTKLNKLKEQWKNVFIMNNSIERIVTKAILINYRALYVEICTRKYLPPSASP